MAQVAAPIRHADRFYIGGQWAAPSTDATISVIGVSYAGSWR